MLWQIDEKELFQLSNPDGYFYLLFLKMSGLFFAISKQHAVALTVKVSVISWLILPSYFEFNNKLNENQSNLNKLVYNPASSVTTRVVLLMYVYVVLAYVFIYKFSKRMSSFEFSSQVEYHDRYVARHAIIIRGVSRDIGTNEVARKIGKLFEQRFTKD